MSDNDSSEDNFGGMFTNEEEDKEQERLKVEHNKRVDIKVPRYILLDDNNNDSDNNAKTYIESPTPLILRHRPGKHHSLWGHLLWNAGRHIVYLMDSGKINVKGKSVIELGCGVAAPSFVAALNGARVVCATDYPDEDLIEVVAENAAKVLVIDDDTNNIFYSNNNNDDKNAVHAPNQKIEERFTKEEMEKILLDDRVRDIVINKSGLQFKNNSDNNISCETENGNASSSQSVTNDDDKKKQPQKQEQAIFRKKLNFFVEGLCWGNNEHIQNVCDKASTSGFDIIFLSDLMFNHICHDQLIATVSRLLARDFNSRAYVVFSFHRVHKKYDDLNFFKKCEFYGLQWKLVEENNDYPLMFPDDPGDDSIRKPVNVYELSLTMESLYGEKAKKNKEENDNNTVNSAAASAPLDKFKYDVVVQGTGLVETLISASCARAGLTVLHLDASDQYGGAFFSTTTQDRFKVFLDKTQREGQSVIATPCIDRLEKEVEQLKKKIDDEAKKKKEQGNENEKKNDADDDDGDNSSPSKQLQLQLSDLEFSLQDCKKVLASRQLNFDAFTTPFLAQSDLITSVAHSQMAEHIEFQNVHRVVSIQQSPKTKLPSVSRVPVTRKDVFNAGTSCFPMLEARRLMRFIQDLSNQSALERDTDVYRERHSNEAVAALQEALSKNNNSNDAEKEKPDLSKITIHDLLTKEYKFSQNLIDLVTLGCTLLKPQQTSAEDAASVIFNYLMSIGRYSGSTPYLAPMYSASDLPQIFSRMSAVWATCFALERSVVKIVRVENSFLKDSGDSYSFEKQAMTSPTPNDIAMPPNGYRLLLDNGQHISAKCFVCPRLLINGTNENNNQEEFIRAIIVSKKALITWQVLEETCGDKAVDDDDKNLRLNCSEPLCVGYCKLVNNDSSSSSSVSCSLLQWNDLLEQSPNHIVLTHVTVRRSEFETVFGDSSSSKTFLDAIRQQLFVSSASSNDSNNDEKNAKPSSLYASWDTDVIFASSFFWGEDEAFVSCFGGEENKKMFADSAQSLISKTGGAACTDSTDDNDEDKLHIFEAQTLFGDLNDSLYAAETEKVFRKVLRACGRKDTKEEMPIVKGRAVEAEEEKE